MIKVKEAENMLNALKYYFSIQIALPLHARLKHCCVSELLERAIAKKS